MRRPLPDFCARLVCTIECVPFMLASACVQQSFCLMKLARAFFQCVSSVSLIGACRMIVAFPQCLYIVFICRAQWLSEAASSQVKDPGAVVNDEPSFRSLTDL